MAALISISEAAKMLGVHESRVYRLVQDGDLKVVHTGGRRRYLLRSKVEVYRRRRDKWLTMHGRATTVKNRA
jgi:excisionase family DNA binding protein